MGSPLRMLQMVQFMFALPGKSIAETLPSMSCMPAGMTKAKES